MRRERFRLNSPNVIAETIDGEAILVDLRTGSYYSIQGSGSTLWDAIAAGASVDRLADAVASAYSVEPSAAEEAVSSFCAELEREGLIVSLDGMADSTPEPPFDLSSSNGQVFSPPAVEKYTDMQDLVLLDPVHEVDERGWPHARA
ncbi:MAG: PqqD family protein [Actinomycetota bacterium]|nr:PqqD family protein [Actinomycetota bacterium]